MIKEIPPSSKRDNIQAGFKDTNKRTSSSIPKQRNNVESVKVTKKFLLEKIGVTEKLNVQINHENIKEIYKGASEAFLHLFNEHIPKYDEKFLTQDRISLITLVAHPTIVHNLYAESCGVDKKALSGLGAMYLRLLVYK